MATSTIKQPKIIQIEGGTSYTLHRRGGGCWFVILTYPGVSGISADTTGFISFAYDANTWSVTEPLSNYMTVESCTATTVTLTPIIYSHSLLMEIAW